MHTDKDKTDAKVAALVQEIFRPVLRGYFAVLALYYTSMLPFSIWLLEGSQMVSLVTVSLIAIFVGCFGFWYMRIPATARIVERLLFSMNMVVIANILVALNISFVTVKLTYFVIAAMIFALASLNFRQSAVSIGVTGVALFSFFPDLSSAHFSVFAFLTFAVALASLAIAFFLRKAITNIAEAKFRAERQLAEARDRSEELREKSLSDSLTQLPNRRAFFAMLRDAVARALQSNADAGSDRRVWLLLLDLDGFKTVNDVHGHMTGDLLLQQVAHRLESFAGDDFYVSRMGGDEFNLIKIGSCGTPEIRRFCDELLALLSKPYNIDGRHILISCSIGCKQLDLHSTTRSQLTKADYALMMAKQTGKNKYVIFNSDLAKIAQEKLDIEKALRRSDLSKEIGLAFQPQVDLRTNTITRAEVLARWNSPFVGQIKPQRFVKIAEESGLITGVTLVVVEKALAELSNWSNPIPLSINISSYDLITDTTIDEIIALTKAYQADPKLIEFEVTETAMMADFEKACTNLKRLTAFGFTIALDDFGTGYSNFSYLRALPITKLKVDKSFIDNPADPMTEKILSSLTGMARILGVHCLLEGVEDEIDLLMAKRAGAESVQGYLFGKPMSSSALMKLVAEPQPKSTQAKLSAQV